MNNEIITVKELANYLKISRSKAYKLANTPGFPVIRINKSMRIKLSDLNNWLNNLQNHDIFNFEPESRRRNFE